MKRVFFSMAFVMALTCLIVVGCSKKKKGDDKGKNGKEKGLTVKVEPAEAEFTEKKAGEKKIKVTIERKNDLKGKVNVSVKDLPDGVTAEDVEIAADKTEGELTLKGTDKTAEGTKKATVTASGDGKEATAELNVKIKKKE